jgi:hypothetical protein
MLDVENLPETRFCVIWMFLTDIGHLEGMSNSSTFPMERPNFIRHPCPSSSSSAPALPPENELGTSYRTALDPTRILLSMGDPAHHQPSIEESLVL